MAQFGDLLSELRQDRRMTQDQLAKILFVTAGTISNYENNVHFPDVEKLILLADYFGVTTDYLLGRCSSNFSPDILETQIVPGKTTGQMIEDFKALPFDRQNALILVMNDMKFSTVLAKIRRDNG